MRVVLAAVSSAAQLSGVQRHAFNVAACLSTVPEISRVDLVLASWQRQLAQSHAPQVGPRMHLHFADIANTALARNGWFFGSLPALARDLQADVVHLAYPVPLRRNAFPCPVVVTMHDLYAYESPKNFGLAKAWINRRVLQQCLRTVDAIACVSDATAQALRTYTTPHIWRKALRIYNCVQLSSRDVQPLRIIPDETPFLLCVAQHRHNKNIPLALRSFRYLLQTGAIDSRMRLFVIGIPGPDTPGIRRQISRLELTDRVALVNGLSDEELLWCYRHCAVLLIPSLSEGFGLPAVEALMAGCRVVCSSIPALHEVGGSYCRFVPATEKDWYGFAVAVREELQQPVPTPVSFPQFSPAEIAREYMAVYRDVIACRSRTRRPLPHAQVRSASSEGSTL